MGGEGGNISPTSQNSTPLLLFPHLSRGGDQVKIPITLGTTKRIPPATPDLAGRPTWITELWYYTLTCTVIRWMQ